MSRLTDRIKHAFAVESEDSLQPTDQQRDVVDRVCKEIVRRHLTTPALLFLEMSRPLNYCAAQAMHWFQPILAIVLDTQGYTVFAEFLEHRGSIAYICRRIEHLEQHATQGDAPAISNDDCGESRSIGRDL